MSYTEATPWSEVPGEAEPVDRGFAKLADGRSLGWTAWGASDGEPVLSQPHTGVSGRRALEVDVKEVSAAGVRLIEVSRAGLGVSSPNPGRTAQTDGNDMLQLADRLGLERFPVVGQCGGAGAVLALAAQLSKRVTRVHLVSPLAPLHGAQAKSYMTPGLRRWRSYMRFELTGRWAIRAQALTFQRDHDAFLERTYSQGADADRSLLANPAQRALELAVLDEFYRLPTKVAFAEQRSVISPWSIDWSSIRVPVTIEHGEADPVAPVEMARWLAQQLPTAQLRVIPDRGHLLPGAYHAELLRELIGNS